MELNGKIMSTNGIQTKGIVPKKLRACLAIRIRRHYMISLCVNLVFVEPTGYDNLIV